MSRYLVRWQLAVILIVLGVQNSLGMNFYEFLIGPKINSRPLQSDRRGRSKLPPKAKELVIGFGYPFEVHNITSETGHILELHRIPEGIKKKHQTHRPVALIHHGFLATSDGWLFRGPKYDLPYTLADAGYDVWMCNARGNFYSRKHTYLNPDRDVEYWTFSLHEMGYYDLPVVIDYVLNQTNQEKMQYIGHSMGSSVAFILCALRPEYNEKISHHIALGPLANIVHRLSPAHSVMFNFAGQILQTALKEKIYEFMPRREHFSNLVEMVCSEEMPTKQLCVSGVFMTVGPDPLQFDTSLIPQISTYYPAGTSLFVLFHIVRIFVERKFEGFDYEDPNFNMFKYNSTEPPMYNLSLVTTPTSIHYGNGDSLIMKEDVISIAEKLPNVVGVYKVPHEEFNHLDFFWAKDSKTLLYDNLVRLMNKFR